MRTFAVIALSTALLASSSLVAGAETGALAPGKPAGVATAQQGTNGFLLFAGIAVVAGGIALVASSGNSGGNITTTTTTAP